MGSEPSADESRSVNDLDHAPLMLLVRCTEDEAPGELLASLQERYDARLQDAEFGPRYKVGPTFVYRGQRFSKICTFAGSLVMRIVFDARQGKFDRAVIYRLASDQCLRLLNPGGPESEVLESGLAEQRPDDESYAP
jgi:hypothetical protein